MNGKNANGITVDAQTGALIDDVSGEEVVSSVTVWDPKTSLPMARKELKSGALSVQPLSRKQFAETEGSKGFGLKGQALKRAHSEYLLSTGKDGNAALTAKIARGEVLMHKWAQRMGKDGEVVGYDCRFNNIEQYDLSTDPKLALSQVSTADLLKALEARKAAEAAAQAPAPAPEAPAAPAPAAPAPEAPAPEAPAQP